LDSRRTFQCPYIRYSVHGSALFELGIEGIGSQQYVRELYTGPHPARELLSINNRDLKIFVKDLLFNFTLKQALDSLKDPGVLAKVAQLCTLVAQVPVYADFAPAVQNLSVAVYKFQKHFNN